MVKDGTRMLKELTFDIIIVTRIELLWIKWFGCCKCVWSEANVPDNIFNHKRSLCGIPRKLVRCSKNLSHCYYCIVFKWLQLITTIVALTYVSKKNLKVESKISKWNPFELKIEEKRQVITLLQVSHLKKVYSPRSPVLLSNMRLFWLSQIKATTKWHKLIVKSTFQTLANY